MNNQEVFRNIAINPNKYKTEDKKQRLCSNDPTTCPFCLALGTERELHNELFSFVEALISRFVQENWFTNNIDVGTFLKELKTYSEKPEELGEQFKGLNAGKNDLQLMGSYVKHLKLPFSSKNVRNQRYHSYMKRVASREGEEVFARDNQRVCERKGLKGTYKRSGIERRRMFEDEVEEFDVDPTLLKGWKLRGFNEPTWKMVC
jgi:glutathionylspermidine synthase